VARDGLIGWASVAGEFPMSQSILKSAGCIPAAPEIELIIGLPHLNAGPLLERAIGMQLPVLISANALSRWRGKHDAREWIGWRLGPLAKAVRLHSVDLDSAGFVAMSRYGGFPWSIDAYFELAGAFPFRRIASLDYCTEHEIASDREEVLDRILRTIAANRQCRVRAEDLGLIDRLMPVIQGRSPADYERCADALWRSMTPGRIIGVGSMCRRPNGGSDGIAAVVEHLDRVLPAGVILHLFGVKGSALPFLTPLAHRVASVDSQAYGIAARQDALRSGVRKTERLVAAYMEKWVRAQHCRLAGPPRYAERALPLAPGPRPIDPWEHAIAEARAQIRALIESGDLDHDEITAGWIEQWAADIFRGRSCADKPIAA
jgi:hypothetical protein